MRVDSPLEFMTTFWRKSKISNVIEEGKLNYNMIHTHTHTHTEIPIVVTSFERQLFSAL